MLFDSSSSMMEECYDTDSQMMRIDAVKQIFDSFSNRSMSYDFQHVICLVMFNDKVKILLKFTENLETFKVFLSWFIYTISNKEKTFMINSTCILFESMFFFTRRSKCMLLKHLGTLGYMMHLFVVSQSLTISRQVFQLADVASCVWQMATISGVSFLYYWNWWS